LDIASILNHNATSWINKLNLQEHPEGGYFIETYKSEKSLEMEGYEGPRPVSSAIYFLLAGEQFSSFHRMKSDELWHFYTGSSLTLHIIEPGTGRLKERTLGADFEKGESFQIVVKSGSWFAASIIDHDSYSLVGCTASPGFDYRDWELGDMKILAKRYPQHKAIIEKYALR
jgi:uncharacterized protein